MRSQSPPKDAPRRSFLRATAWMVGLSVLLFWLPILGPLIAGLVGGRAAGTVGRALAAAFMPAVLLGALVAVVLLAFDLPVIGALAGSAVILVILAEDLPLFLGAWLGALATRP